MANNKNLHKANKAKNDEFYTQYKDIELEIEAYNKENFTGKTVYCCCDDVFTSNFAKYFLNNFKRLELKELIVSGFSTTEKGTAYYFRTTDPAKYIEDGNFKTELIKTEVKEMKKDGIYDGGDFRSAMATELLKQSDIVITNPPFSLFREFIAWIMEADKKFIIIGNKNAITYKEVFPLIMKNKMWLGATANGSDMVFGVPDGYKVAEKDKEKAKRLGYIGNYTRLGNSSWFTNVDHGKRHQKLSLMTMEENIKYSKHKSLREQGYLKYDNYDAIEVPYTDAIPSDYEPCWFKCPHAKECVYAQTEGFTDEALCENKCNGAMGVPITYLDKHNPDDFEIIKFRKGNDDKDLSYTIDTCEKGFKKKRQESLHTSESSFARKCNGIMEVPITFLDKFCPEQFRIIGEANNGSDNEFDLFKPLLNKRYVFKRILIQKV
jgi:hypothetical protein